MTAPPAPSRIIVADDHPLWRRGIADFLDGEDDLQVVAQAEDGAQALAAIRAHAPDVVLLDMEMPVLNGVGVMKAIREEGLHTHVLAVSAYDEPEYVIGLMNHGASGYITKEKPPALLLEAVRAIAAGESRWFVRAPARRDETLNLSEREREVLTLLAKGKSNRGIGEALFISENTVRNHLGSLYLKLEVSGAREAVAWAWRHGLGTTD